MLTKTVMAISTCVLLAACGGAGTPTTTDIADSSLSLQSGPALTIETGVEDVNFADLLNNLRVSRDLAPVSYDARLDRAAQKHAEDMIARDYFSHDTLGATPSVNGHLYDRIAAEGYEPRGWAENIAQGQQSQGQVLQAWIDSPGHNRNLNANLQDFALGAAGSGRDLTWVLVMATER